MSTGGTIQTQRGHGSWGLIHIYSCTILRIKNSFSIIYGKLFIKYVIDLVLPTGCQGFKVFVKILKFK